MWEYQRTLVWTNTNGWTLKHEKTAEVYNPYPTMLSEPDDEWTKLWILSTPPPYIIWQRWGWMTDAIKDPNNLAWRLLQQGSNWGPAKKY